MKQYITTGLLLLMLYLFVQTSGLSAQPTAGKLHILVISSFSKDIPAQVAFESGLNRALEYKQGKNRVYFEFMESPYLSEKNVTSKYAEYLQHKYKDVQLDAVIGWASRAGTFLLRNRGLFPDVARIYIEATSMNADDKSKLSTKDTVIGIDYDFDKTFKEIMRLEHPKKIIVVGSTRGSTGKARLKMFRDSLNKEGADVQVEYLLDRTMEGVERKLEKESRKDTVAVYLLMFSDGKGCMSSNHLRPFFEKTKRHFL